MYQLGVERAGRCPAACLDFVIGGGEVGVGCAKEHPAARCTAGCVISRTIS